jgi:hypothetical protein
MAAGALARGGTARMEMREVRLGGGAHVDTSWWIRPSMAAVPVGGAQHNGARGARRRARCGGTASWPHGRSGTARIKDGDDGAGARARGTPVEEVGGPPRWRYGGGPS